ncbi:MAG: hypothetical protein JSV68_11835 [Anaerolineaceae bacterium]|nr:MAG: hypothetical protein JSV68_11835 [Anaerolineaceae bacterium]
MYDKIENIADALAERDYEHARRRAFWRKIRSLLGRKCNDLLPAERVLNNLLNQEFRSLGLQQVPIERIVGSSGRYRDFDLAFLPLRQEHDGRWQSVARARRQGFNLPPPLLYNVGDTYFVEDGNHRISVASASGQEYIEANVIAIDASALKAEPSCTRLGYKIAGYEPQNKAVSCSA